MIDTVPTVKRSALDTWLRASDRRTEVEFLPTRADQMSLRQELTRESSERLRPELFGKARQLDNSHYRTNKPGLAWIESTRQLVEFESRLESLCLLILDFEGQLRALAPQPMTLHFSAGKSKASHTPDFFARLRSGAGVLVDVKPRQLLQQPKVAEQFAATRAACLEAGWEYRVMSTPGPRFAINVNLLAGYRRQPAAFTEALPALEAALESGPVEWAYLTRRASAVSGVHPALMPPALLHGIWRGDLMVDLDCELRSTTLVALRAGEGS